MKSLKPEQHLWCNVQQQERLKELLNTNAIHFLTKSSGGNSKVFCVIADEQRWAVKSYPPHQPNQRDRLAAEITAYRFLNQENITAVPFLKAYCEKERWLIMNWIDGEQLKNYSPSDISQALQFIRNITALNSKVVAIDKLPQAAEACLSLTILIHQIAKRYQRLLSLPEQDVLLVDFLTKEFTPVFEHYKNKALQGYAKAAMDPDQELPQEMRSLVPSDFGFHNAIRDTTGKLYFFDFDYFGWDDPVKLLADILWHPKMQFSSAQELEMIEAFTDIYKQDAAFPIRFSFTFPLFGLRWVLILLNEFIGEYWLNRLHAGAHEDRQTAKLLQLQRAKDLLKRVIAGICCGWRAKLE